MNRETHFLSKQISSTPETLPHLRSLTSLASQTDDDDDDFPSKQISSTPEFCLECFGARFQLTAYQNVNNFGTNGDGEEYLAIGLYVKHSQKSVYKFFFCSTFFLNFN